MKSLKPHEERVVNEKRELDEKIAKLKTFLNADNYIFRSLDPIDRSLLNEQYVVMEKYSAILEQRIARFCA